MRVLRCHFCLSKSIMKFYTLGYQGIDASTYVRIIKSVGVGVVIDVRETAWSYKRDFCKTAFSANLSKSGIEYIHLPNAGNPKENRRTAASMEECLRRYRMHLRKNSNGLKDLLGALNAAESLKKSACLMCFESEPESCHRSILAAAVVQKNKNFTPVHLKA
jgi:uncharacterized protein (DUF488 family)